MAKHVSRSSGGFRAVAMIATAVGAAAVGAFAIGALAIGALAIRRLAIGRLTIERGEFKSLVVEDLTVTRLHLPPDAPGMEG